jgi:putative ABC transport system permease protein
MKLPLKYSLRSLTQRRLRSLVTVLGVALSIFLALLMLALTRGMLAATRSSGDDANVLVLSKGAESLEFSALDPEALHLLQSAPGVQQQDGIPLASPEAYLNSVISLPGMAEDSRQTCVVRGVLSVAQQVHPQVELTAGELPQRGYQALVGRLVATKLGIQEAELAVGRTLHYEGQDWTICGRFAAPGTTLESEIWSQLDDLMVASKRTDYSALVLRTTGGKASADLLFDLATRTDVQVSAQGEREYFAAVAQNMKPVQAVSIVMTALLVLGGLLAGMNTMFNSIVGRTKEMAVLQVLGYRRHAVLLGFILESVLLCTLGGLVAAACSLLLNGIPMRFTMSAFTFIADGLTIVLAVAMAVFIGVTGALAPVLRVSRLPVVTGLRGS